MKLYLLMESSFSQETVNSPQINWGDGKKKKKSREHVNAFSIVPHRLFQGLKKRFIVSLLSGAKWRVSRHLYHQPW